MVDIINDHDQLSNPYAIQLTDVTVHLGNKNVLRSVNLSIEQGGIFALLGPSGCGKTSLIRTLVGRLHPTINHDKSYGTISILGKHSYAFGQLVGFMPQEMALHPTNTINEELFFYGRLANMSSEKLQQRCEFLINLLELPNREKLIRKLSGGQQRRVSFAIALIHEPKLLILDEPTVGVDPLLRRKIWKHLTEITMSGDRTAIVTTHYIEEARQANIVSFMRHGQLLETGRPNDLLLKYGQQVEDVFFELCEKVHILEIQNHEQERKHHHKSLTVTNKLCQTTVSSSPKKKCCTFGLHSCARPSFGRSLYALLIKDVLKFQRNPFMLMIHLLVPILQIALFCLCVGRKLSDIQVGFISREVIRSSSTTGLILDKIDKNVLNLIEYKSISDAQYMFKSGYLSGIIDIGENFSKEFLQKIEECSLSDENKYNDSQMLLYVDQTNRQMIYTIAEEFLRVFKSVDIDYHLGLWTSTSSDKTLFKLGQFENNQSDFEYTFTHFMVPGIILSVIFFLNVALTALSLVIEQSDGTQDRVWITGVKSNEIILSQLIIHSIILIIQITIILFTTLVIFKFPLRGSLVLISLLCIIQGFCGMTFGLVISTIFTTEVNAHQVTMAAFYPVLLLSGIVWPLEGQPIWIRTITKWLPMTKAIEAMRGILLREWNMNYLIVQQAFAVTFIWTMLFLILTLVIFNYRRL
ncbi:unnamed protein product [Adineta steineri]|uniref:Uncharacterized protein n=1 Tax=Adineta steineri TaxID=433720 RepID=A0A815DDG1_9BILA|nr:unnamed protein product [Adineta steineri]